MFLSFKSYLVLISLILVGLSAAVAQDVTVSKEKPAATEKPSSKDDKKDDKSNKQNDLSKLTAEGVAESAIIVYGGSVLGRQSLGQIRKTTIERGKMLLTDAGGRTETALYERVILRGETLAKEKVRMEQAFPDSRFALIYNGEKIFGLFNETVFAPRDDASASFQNQIWHGLEGLLRYKENEATLKLSGREKIMGVEYFFLDVTDKQSRTTRYYVSTRSFRVMFLEYQQAGVTYKRKFYDHRYAQGTLVPYRSVLYANDKQVEETQIGTITFGQKIDESVFNES